MDTSIYKRACSSHCLMCYYIEMLLLPFSVTSVVPLLLPETSPMSLSYILFSTEKKWLTSAPFLQIGTKCFLVAVREQSLVVSTEMENGICPLTLRGQGMVSERKENRVSEQLFFRIGDGECSVLSLACRAGKGQSSTIVWLDRNVSRVNTTNLFSGNSKRFKLSDNISKMGSRSSYLCKIKIELDPCETVFKWHMKLNLKWYILFVFTNKNEGAVLSQPIRVAERSKACTVLVRSNTGIVGSNLTQGMDICLRLFCVCV
jgi:hypothetical protein